MHPVNFEGATVIQKPENMTDEQCTAIWAKFGLSALPKIAASAGGIIVPPGLYADIDSEGFPYYMTAWQPSKEDIEAINAGLPIYVKTVADGLPPMALFTVDTAGNANF